MFNGGDFQSGVYAGGGSIKESDIKVGAKFRLANGEVIEIKRLFIENMDENWVEFTRNGKSQETSVRSLKIFINNWREGKSKYAMGGSLESHGIRVGDTFLKTLSGGIQKVKDKNGQIVYINLANGERNSQPPFPFDDGGMVSKDLFEYYDEQPKELAKIVDFYMEKFNDGDYDYVDSKNFLKEVNAIGYTFDYGLDNTPYGLRPIGTKLETFDDGGEVTYFINKDGVRVRSKVEPKQKLSEAEWMAKHNQSKDARVYGLGGLFGRAKNTLKQPKYPNLEGKQVSLKNGKMVQVFDQNGSELSVLELGRIGTGERPYLVDISEVDMSSFKNGGSLNLPKEGDVIKNTSNYGNRITKVDNGYVYWIDKYAKEQYCKITDLKLNNLDDDGDDDGYYEDDVNYWITSKPLGYKRGGVLIGNQKRIDMNKNGKIDAEDFKILRSSMNGAWRKEHKYVNSTSRKNGKVIDYEVKYARKNNPARTGYKGKRNFAGGGSLPNGSINALSDLWFAVQQRDTSEYKILSKILDDMNIPYSIQNQVSADAETQRGRKALNIPEVHDRITKIVEKNGRKFSGGGGISKFTYKTNNKIFADDLLKYADLQGIKASTKKVGSYYYVTTNNKIEVRESMPKDLAKIVEGKKFKEGGGISNFERLSRIVAKNYEGKSVKPKYQKEYGKTYSKAEAKEVGNKVAGKVKTMKKAESGTTVKKGNRGGVMVLAKQIRKQGESWKDALKRAGQQLK